MESSEVEGKQKVLWKERQGNKESRVKTGGGGLAVFLVHLRCQSLSRPLAQYVKLLLPSNAPECLDTYSSSHPSANQQSMPTSAVPADPLTFQSSSEHTRITAVLYLSRMIIYLQLHLNIGPTVYTSISQYIHLSRCLSIHQSKHTREYLQVRKRTDMLIVLHFFFYFWIFYSFTFYIFHLGLYYICTFSIKLLFYF